ncbi:MAG: site-specific DNA-methyltransferase, partial [Rhodomicrobium sp.]
MILGDSLQVMASLAANREALRGEVQCIFLDPPYGIKFNSNWQVSTRDRDVKDGKREFQSREPEVVRAFRDTWTNGIHSYLSYLRDRFRLAHDLLGTSGSFFLQIGDENLHLCKLIAKEIFGDQNFIAQISFLKTTSATSGFISSVSDYILWFAKDISAIKYRPLYKTKETGGEGAAHYSSLLLKDGTRRPLSKGERRDPKSIPEGAIPYTADQLQSAGMGREKGEGAASWFKVEAEGRSFTPTMQSRWKTNEIGLERLKRASRVLPQDSTIRFLRKISDFPAYEINNIWTDVGGASDKRYVVETTPKIVERCILMTTDPGDLVLDPTCGSGTTAFVAEQWGRRWITIDTSRVALTLARSRIMGARYPFYALKDSEAGAIAEEELRLRRKLMPDESNTARSRGLFKNDIANGFVYHRAPHITLRSIANNSEIDVIWTTFQGMLEPLREELNKAAGTSWEEWQIPRSPVYPWVEKAAKLHAKIKDLLEERGEFVTNWDRGSDETDGRDLPKHDKKIARAIKELNAVLNRNYNIDTLPEHAGEPLQSEAIPFHTAWWEKRLERQAKIDASIAANAVDEPLVDRPYEVKGIVRVAGPFTFDSLSPHRVLPANEEDPFFLSQLEEAEDGQHRISGTRLAARAVEKKAADSDDFIRVVLDNLKAAGVGNTKKGERLRFTALRAFPGRYVNAEGRYIQGDIEDIPERKAAIFIGPEYGTVSRSMIVAAAREAADLFDVLVVCGFAFEAHASADTMKLGRLTVLKVNMNQDLRMGDRLKSVDQGNLFVVFGEPDIEFRKLKNGQYEVEILGVDIFNPNSGEQKSSSKVEEDVACWFIDDDYNESSFFVRQAYFLGGKDPYDKLKTALKAEIDEEAWSVLYSKVSRPFDEPSKGKIAVKVINHFGDEVMQVYDTRDAKGL